MTDEELEIVKNTLKEVNDAKIAELEKVLRKVIVERDELHRKRKSLNLFLIAYLGDEEKVSPKQKTLLYLQEANMTAYEKTLELRIEEFKEQIKELEEEKWKMKC